MHRDGFFVGTDRECREVPEQRDQRLGLSTERVRNGKVRGEEMGDRCNFEGTIATRATQVRHGQAHGFSVDLAEGVGVIDLTHGWLKRGVGAEEIGEMQQGFRREVGDDGKGGLLGKQRVFFKVLGVGDPRGFVEEPRLDGLGQVDRLLLQLDLREDLPVDGGGS